MPTLRPGDVSLCKSGRTLKVVKPPALAKAIPRCSHLERRRAWQSACHQVRTQSARASRISFQIGGQVSRYQRPKLAAGRGPAPTIACRRVKMWLNRRSSFPVSASNVRASSVLAMSSCLPSSENAIASVLLIVAFGIAATARSFREGAAATKSAPTAAVAVIDMAQIRMAPVRAVQGVRSGSLVNLTASPSSAYPPETSSR